MNDSNSSLDARWANGTLTLTPARSPVRIGRLSDCAIQIADPMTSGHQGTLLFLNGRWHFEDRSSTNGTWLRGRRVSHAEIAGPTQLALGGIEGPVLQLNPHPQSIGASPQLHLSSANEVDGTTTSWWRRERQPIVVQSLTIGRALDADHPVADMLASRAHARLDLLDDGSARIVDLNSVNGTYVDGVAALRGSRLVVQSLCGLTTNRDPLNLYAEQPMRVTHEDLAGLTLLRFAD